MHFNKPGSARGTPWTVHYRGVCHIVAGIECHVKMTSEWKPHLQTNPRAFFAAQVSNLEISKEGIAILT